MRNMAKMYTLAALLTVGAGLGHATSLCNSDANNLVTNCGFETGTFAGWSTTNASSGSDYGVLGASHSGNFEAEFGATAFDNDIIHQTLSTIAGENYNLSFYVNSDSANADIAHSLQMEALWDGSQVLNLTTRTSSAGFILYSFDVTASSSATTLQFDGRAQHSFFFLDDIQVDDLHTSSTLTPEPTSLVLLAGGLISLLAAKKK